MPWTVAKEYVPGVVLNAKERAVLDGKQLLDVESVDRLAQLDPLEVLRSCVATHDFNTSTGVNIFQICSQTAFDGRGQRFYRREWMEGTYEKYVTLSAVEFDSSGSSGKAFGYITFHGESTTVPVEIDHAGTPGWVMSFDAASAIPYGTAVPPPPSIGTDTKLDLSMHRLRSYPFYDAPNPSDFIVRLLKDRGVVPDVASDGEQSPPADLAGDSASEPYPTGA